MNSAVAWRTLEGNTIDGKFPLRQWLGGTDLSAVFLTERLLLGVTGAQRAAIKLIPATGDPADQLARWAAAAQLSHPHLIRIFDSGRCQIDGERYLYVVTEFADEDLSQILPQRPLTPGEASDMLPPLLDALSYLHAKGYVHGHVRPTNVLAVGDQLKLTSDQLVRISANASEQRRRDIFDAPETAAGIFSPESDVWSVGATLAVALTQGTGLPDGGPQGDPKLPASIPEPFRGIARECLHLDPKRRSSISEILARLQPAGRSVPAEQEVRGAVLPRRPSRAPVTVAILVIALVVGLIAFFSRGKKAQPPEFQQTPQPAPAATPAAAKPAPSVTSNAPPTITAPPATQAPPKRSAKHTATGGAVLHQVLPEVPQSARNTITGKIRVVVRVDVDGSGKVTAAKLTSPGPSKYFARLALNAAQRWEFSPAEVAGQPLPSAWQIRFRIGRRNTEVSSEKISR